MATSYKTWVKHLVGKIATNLNLQEWRIEVYFDDADDEENATAWTCVDSRYLVSHIHFTPVAEAMWKDGEYGILRECLVHEVMHIFLNPLHEFAKKSASPVTENQLTDTLEQTTQRLTRVVMAHLPKNFFQI